MNILNIFLCSAGKPQGGMLNQLWGEGCKKGTVEG